MNEKNGTPNLCDYIKTLYITIDITLYTSLHKRNPTNNPSVTCFYVFSSNGGIVN
jgi:hypothetical protein